MPNNVYQPNSPQNPSSKMMNQAYRDTLGSYRCHSKISAVSSTLSTTSRTLTSQGPADARLVYPRAIPKTYNDGDTSCFTTIPHPSFVRDHPTPHRERRPTAILDATVAGFCTDVISQDHAPIATTVAAMVGCTATVVSKPSSSHTDQHRPQQFQPSLSSSHPRGRIADPAPHDARAPKAPACRR